jgi:DNA-directed RNA polymerase specialized sigma24 family protein
MFNDSNSSSAGLIPHQPMPPGAQDFSKRVSGLLDGQSKDEVQVKQALEGMDAMLDAIAAGMYSLASMLVGEGEDGVRLVETAVATAEVSACEDAAGARKNSRRALVSAGLDLLARREPGCLAAPEGIEPAGGCIEDDELEAAGVSLAQLEQMIGGPDRDRVRAWLAKLPAAVRAVFVMRAVAGFTAAETAGLLAEYGGPQAMGWSVEGVRSVFRQGLCSLASQLLQASGAGTEGLRD